LNGVGLKLQSASRRNFHRVSTGNPSDLLRNYGGYVQTDKFKNKNMYIQNSSLFTVEKCSSVVVKKKVWQMQQRQSELEKWDIR
jgi:hypothetical protein